MRVLREAGIIRIRAEKTFSYITLRQEELEERFPGLLRSVLSSAQKETDCRSFPGAVEQEKGELGENRAVGRPLEEER